MRTKFGPLKIPFASPLMAARSTYLFYLHIIGIGFKLRVDPAKHRKAVYDTCRVS